MTDFARVKRNVAKTIRLGAPEAKIDTYVASEGVTPAQLRGQSAPKPKGPPPKPRSPMTACADTPTRRPARPAPLPTGVMPVQPELMAPLRALGGQTTALAPKPRAPRVQPAPVPMEPGVASKGRAFAIGSKDRVSCLALAN